MQKSFPTQIQENEINPIKNDSINNEKALIDKTKDHQTNEKKNFNEKIENNTLARFEKSNKEQNIEYVAKKNLGTSPEQFLENCNSSSREPKAKNTLNLEKNQLLKNLIIKIEQKIREVYKKNIENEGKQYNGHYNNSRKQDLNKGQWPKREECLLFNLYKKSLFEGETNNMIKNHFFSQLRKQAFQKNNETQNPKLKKSYKDSIQFLSIVNKEDKNKFCKLQKTNETQFNDLVKIKEQTVNSFLPKKMANKSKKKFDFLQKKTKRDNIDDEEIEEENKFTKNEKNKILNKFSSKSLNIVSTDSFQILVSQDETNLNKTPLIKLYINNLFNFNSFINEYHISQNNIINNNFVNCSYQEYGLNNHIVYNNYCDHINNNLVIPENNYNTYSQSNYKEGTNKEDSCIVNEILREVHEDYFNLTDIIIGLDRLLIKLNKIENNS